MSKTSSKVNKKHHEKFQNILYILNVLYQVFVTYSLLEGRDSFGCHQNQSVIKSIIDFAFNSTATITVIN